MSEEANQSVDQEIEAVAQPSESSEHDDVSTQAQGNQPSKRSDAEYNFAELRRQRERDREELAQLKAELNRMQSPQRNEEDDIGINDDDLIEGKHLKNLYKEIKQLKSEQKAKESSQIEKMIQLQFPDYYSVVSKENLEFLEQTDPELAESLLYYPDEYKKRAAAYKLIKKSLGNTKDNSNRDRMKAQENSQKPLSVNAVTKNSAIGNAHLFENGLTKDLKTNLWKEMQQAMKGA